MRPDQSLHANEHQTELASIEILGRHIEAHNSPYFEGLVRKHISSETIDVTGWTREAIRILITVCREKNIHITIKSGDRYATIVRYPSGKLLDPLVTSIISSQ
jgi:hypothetical protein